MDKRLILSHIFTSYLYYTICISKREYERLSKLLRITKWLSCQNLSLVSSVVGRHLGCPRCTVIGTQCVKTDTKDLGYRS